MAVQRGSRSGRLALAWLVSCALLGCERPPERKPAPPVDAAVAPPPPETPEQRVARLLRKVPLIDGHNDTPWQLRARTEQHLDRLDLHEDTSKLDPPLQTDLARLQQGGLGGQFWSVYVPITEPGGSVDDVRTVLEQIDLTRRMVDRYADRLTLALSADDIVQIHASGKVASLLGMEGGHSIANSLAVLRATYGLGARYMTLTHSKNLIWADSATDTAEANGLSNFGREVVREMNRLGMLVDLSHVSVQTMHAAIDTSDAPVIFSHSSAFAVCQHPRNVPDDVLRRLARNGGIVMVTFLGYYVSEPLRLWMQAQDAERARVGALPDATPQGNEQAMAAWAAGNPAPQATLAQVADHIDHIRAVAGIDHIGIGSDFDGTRSLPVGLEDVSKYPALLLELLRRGYSEEDVEKVMGNNLLRVMRAAEQAAARLREKRGPSEARIQELDSLPPVGARRVWP